MQRDQDEEINQFEQDRRETKKKINLVNRKYKVEQEMGVDIIEKSTGELAKFFCLSIVIIYIIVVSIFFLLFSLSRDFRFGVFEFVKLIEQKGDIKGPLILALVGIISIMLGFDIFVYDILVGFLLKKFLVACALVSFVKIFSKYSMFILARYYMKDFIYAMMHENLYFITCYIAITKKPIKVLTLLQFLALPTVFKTYGVGLFKITHLQYFTVTAISNITWTMLWVYIGCSIENIIEYLETGSTQSLIPKWLQYTLTILSIFTIIYLCNLTRRIYQSIHEDALEAIDSDNI